MWIGDTHRDRTVLPKCWFDMLGDCIDVAAIFKKQFTTPNLSVEEWSKYPFALETFSVTFPGIVLPKIPQLLALFPSDVVNSELAERDRGTGVSELDD